MPPYRETIRGETLAKAKKAARIRLADVLRDMRESTWVEPSNQTLGDYIAKTWLPQVKPLDVPAADEQGITQSTYDMYEYLCRVHIVPALGHIPLQKLTPLMLDAFYREMLAKPKARGGQGTLSPTTVRHAHNVLSIALTRAVKWGIVAKNVCEDASPPIPEKKKPFAWTEEETTKFLKSVKDDKYCAAFWLGLQAGLRRGEIFGLRWQDIDFTTGIAEIKQSVVTTSKGNTLKPPKTEDSQNTVVLSQSTLDALLGHRAKQIRHIKLYEETYGPKSYQDQDLVFANEDGGIRDPNAFGRYFKRRIEEADVRPMRVHDQRHTAATLMANAGIDIKTISDQLRHSQISVTAEMYVGPITKAQKKAAEKLDEILRPQNVAKKTRSPIDPQNLIQ